MMRIKVPGGVLKPEQARVIGRIAADFANGPIPNPHFGNNFLDLTTRQDVQMHWIKMGDVPEIWRRLEEVGITTVQACGDSARNVLCCPVSGLGDEEVIDAYPVARAISNYFTGNREYANLPRKFKMSVTGCLEDCAQAEINDIGMLPARLEDGTSASTCASGGGLSDGPRMASDIDVFVRPEDAVEITRGIAQVYGELGNRENRWINRMRYLVQELGPEGLPRGAREARLRGARCPLARTSPSATAATTSASIPRSVGTDRRSVPLLRWAQRPGGEDERGAVRGGRAPRAGIRGEVRLATDQNLIITGVRQERLDDLLAEPLLERYSPNPGAFERGVVACTGSEFCRFGIVETKIRALEWAREMDRQGRRPRPGRGADALLGLLCLVRAAPDRGHRLQGRDGEEGRRPGRGGGHRARWVLGQGRRLYRLGRGREAGR